jgi:hypothetical protein
MILVAYDRFMIERTRLGLLFGTDQKQVEGGSLTIRLILHFLQKEFTCCLIELLKEKFDHDFEKFLVNSEVQFSHTVDELLLFDSQLKDYLNKTLIYYHKQNKTPLSDTDSSPLNILCDNDKVFAHWLQLEYTVCLKKVDLMFASKNLSEVWLCNFADVDELKPPHCVESFMLLIKTVSGKEIVQKFEIWLFVFVN